eukprot:sb/3475146/
MKSKVRGKQLRPNRIIISLLLSLSLCPSLYLYLSLSLSISILSSQEESCSWDFLDNDSDPTPVVTDSDQNVNHGTRCAGQVAAGRNRYCGLGVAFNARLAGIRMLNTKVEDAVEAKSLEFKRDEIDIYR